MNNLKKISIIFLVVVVIFTIAFFVIKSIPVKEAYISNIDIGTIEDGIYEGSYESTMVKVKVSVKVNNNIIEDITIKEHQTGLGKKAEAIIGDIIDKQSLQVDSITGATVSSNTIKKAVENALMKANTNTNH